MKSEDATLWEAADQNLGHLEEHLLRGDQELFRQMVEKAAQQKAAATPPLCPRCQNKLSRRTDGHGTTILPIYNCEVVPSSLNRSAWM